MYNKQVILPHSPHEVEVKEFLSLMTKGKFIGTIQSTQTGARYTYKVVHSHKQNVYWVSVLVGSDNYRDYKYIGAISHGDNFYPNERLIKATAPSSVAFQWFYRNKNNKSQTDKVRLFHEGRCARCMRKLTDPESIERGVGAECYSIINS